MTNLAALFTTTQLMDLVTANPATEFHPVGAMLLAQPLAAFAAKTALIALVCAIASIIAVKHPRMARSVLVFGLMAGIVGTLSNLP